MAIVPVPGRRSTASDTPEGFEVVIPARRNPFALVFLAFWLCGWAFGEVMAARQLLSGFAGEGRFPELFLAAWLCLWTAGGAFAAFSWLWMMFGSEQVVLTPVSLVIRRRILGVAITREYDVTQVARLRTREHAPFPFDAAASSSFPGSGRGRIAFDYGARTVRFGAALDEAEAAIVVSELEARHRFPR